MWKAYNLYFDEGVGITEVITANNWLDQQGFAKAKA